MNDISKTDWQALAEMTDEEIDYSDITPLSAAFFERAGVWRPQPQVTLELQIDADILEWFQQTGDNWEAQIKAALRFYVESHKAYQTPSNKSSNYAVPVCRKLAERSSMKFQFKVQSYQTAAVESVADCLAGQPNTANQSYRIDPGRGRRDGASRYQAAMLEQAGFKNADIPL